MEFLTESIISVLGATLLERLVPVLPSYLLLIAIGIGAAHSGGSVVALTFASVLGSVLGSGFYYFAASVFGPARALRWGNRLARLSGVSPRRVRRLAISLRRRAASFSLLSQFVPGLRVVAPGLAGAVGIPAMTYFPFAAIGAAIWNLIFIVIGYFTAILNPQADAESIALVVAGIVVLLDFGVGTIWWIVSRYRRLGGSRASSPKAVAA